jgi:hypothetical protein
MKVAAYLDPETHHCLTDSENHYILTVIDIFSKFAWAIPVNRKSGDFTTNAFKSILRKSKRKP